MFSSFNTKSKVIVAALITVVATALYAAVFFATGYAQGVDLQTKEQITTQEASVSKSERIKKLMAESVPEQAQVATYILGSDQVVGFIEEIESLMRRVGIEGTTDAVNTSVYPDVDAKNWEGLSMLISTKGSWTGTYQYLSLLEHLPYKSYVVQAHIGKLDATKETKELWSGEFTLMVLKQK